MTLSRFKPLLLTLVLPVLSALIPASALADGFDSYDYELGPGDQIEILVYGEDELNVDTLVGDSGVINYPYIGEIQVSGLTIGNLKNSITGALKGDYLINPIVQVSIVQYRPFFIDGEVQVPGGYAFQPGLTIVKAAAIAQGFTERASRDKIFITRDVQGDQQRLKANLNTQLRPGDIVTVQQRFF